MNTDNNPADAQELAANSDPEPTAWEQVEPGRFMPRRVRGSFRGQALG